MKYSILTLIICLFTTVGCKEETTGDFIPFEEVSAFRYLESKEEFSEWTRLIRHAGLDGSMNLKSMALTCFVVPDEAVQAWLAKSGYQSVEEIDQEYARNLLRYHIIQGKAYQFSEFKDGRFRDTTASGDYLTTLFVSGQNSGVFINGTTRLLKWDIQVINGIIHVLEDVLTPVSGTMLGFLDRERYSIFRKMVELTETGDLLSETVIEPYGVRSRKALLVVPDSIYREAGIADVESLVAKVSLGHNDYTDEANPLNKYARYHMLLGNYTTLDFSTLLQALYVDLVKGIVLHTRAENEMLHLQNQSGQLVFNPTVAGQAARLLGINYNMQVKNGMVHELNKVIYVTQPPLLKYVFEFADDATYPGLFNLEGYRSKPVNMSHNLKKEKMAPGITWQSMPQAKEDAVKYLVSNTGSYNLTDFWKCSYGDAVGFDLGPVGWVEFQIPPIPKGTYTVKLSFQKLKNIGGNFQIYLDGKKLGAVRQGYVPATGLDSWPQEIVGDYTFSETSSHTFRCAVVKGGKVYLDVLILEPLF